MQPGNPHPALSTQECVNIDDRVYQGAVKGISRGTITGATMGMGYGALFGTIVGIAAFAASPALGAMSILYSAGLFSAAGLVAGKTAVQNAAISAGANASSTKEIIHEIKQMEGRIKHDLAPDRFKAPEPFCDQPAPPKAHGFKETFNKYFNWKVAVVTGMLGMAVAGVCLLGAMAAGAVATGTMASILPVSVLAVVKAVPEVTLGMAGLTLLAGACYGIVFGVQNPLVATKVNNMAPKLVSGDVFRSPEKGMAPQLSKVQSMPIAPLPTSPTANVSHGDCKDCHSSNITHFQDMVAHKQATEALAGRVV